MKVVSARILGLGPFDDLTISFADDAGRPKDLLVVQGGGGVGKTTLLAAIASTRPGAAVALPRQRGRDERATVVVDYALGDDDPARPHPLRVCSPMASLGEPEAEALLRRREQAQFDRAAESGGFALVGFSSARWFSRAATVLTSPERTVLRHDPRATHAFDDGMRGDLARDTKQVLAYASVAAALAPSEPVHVARAEGLRHAVDTLLAPVELAYAGVDPGSLEPTFRAGSQVWSFDELPTYVRHLVALGALSARALSAAYPDEDPRRAEGVVLVDDAAAHLPPHVEVALPELLRAALPRVQWVLTTSSPLVAARVDRGDVVALRRIGDGVVAFDGADACLH